MLNNMLHITIILLALSTLALANNNPVPIQKVQGIYLGAGAGLSYRNYQDSTQTYNTSTLSDTDTAYLLYGGYQLNKIIAVEASYRNYGSFSNTATGSIGGVRTFTNAPESYSVYVNTGYTFTNGLRPFGQLGLGYTYFNTSSSSQDLGLTDGASFVFGLGLEYIPVELAGLGLRIAYVQDLTMNSSYTADNHGKDIHIGRMNINAMFYVGAQYKF
ncbi:porin family protein [Sulfurimonas sp. SAG-AH-194-L11]|nr:outer membrane beta-barrel protein [Sulfurimonas sp. SAG-AH-194-L11]MDF1877030.1 porin family protein [Sulfurimonas sp. SAG-AH-194-L11]